MKTMKSFTPRVGTAIVSALLIGAFISSKGFVQSPSIADAIIQGDGLKSETFTLEKFAGYYQLPNKAAFIQFVVKEDILLAKQLWDNKEYELVQTGEVNFESIKEGHKVEFLKDASGQCTSAKILGRMTIVKVDFNPQITKQLSADKLKPLGGIYSLKDDNSFKIDIRTSASGLTIKQLWDKKEIAFTPRSETFFLNEDGTFPMTFLMSGTDVTQVTCFEDDIWLKEK